MRIDIIEYRKMINREKYIKREIEGERKIEKIVVRKEEGGDEDERRAKS